MSIGACLREMRTQLQKRGAEIRRGVRGVPVQGLADPPGAETTRR